MGYIRPYCGEGLPEDELCPCQAGPDEDEDDAAPASHGRARADTRARTAWRALTYELEDRSSPVRQFLDSRFTAGLRDAQRRYREAAPEIVVPPAPAAEANAGTIGTAADWLLRFLAHPRPDLDLVAAGAAKCLDAGILISRSALDEVLRPLDLMMPLAPSPTVAAFVGPCAGNRAEPDTLNRVCWALALISEAYRGGPAAVARGPLGLLRGRRVSAADLLALAPSAALRQLTSLRRVYEDALIPALAGRRGQWATGPTFEGSAIMKADADLIAAGLLLEVKTDSGKPSLGVLDVFQVVGYALLDFGDEFGISDLGIFRARYAYLATWGFSELLSELAGRAVDVAAVRAEFRELVSDGR